jgi:hypothetical protein
MEWIKPEIEEIDISEQTQAGDGVNFDGRDFEFGDGAGGGGEGGGGAPSS